MGGNISSKLSYRIIPVCKARRLQRNHGRGFAVPTSSRRPAGIFVQDSDGDIASTAHELIEIVYDDDLIATGILNEDGDEIFREPDIPERVPLGFHHLPEEDENDCGEE